MILFNIYKVSLKADKYIKFPGFFDYCYPSELLLHWYTKYGTGFTEYSENILCIGKIYFKLLKAISVVVPVKYG